MHSYLRSAKDYLASDDAALCHLTFERGCFGPFKHVDSLPPAEPLKRGWEEGELESLMALREAALTFLATLHTISGIGSPHLPCVLLWLPTSSNSNSGSQKSPTAAQRSLIYIALRSKRHPGTRYAACQCVRPGSCSVCRCFGQSGILEAPWVWM